MISKKFWQTVNVSIVFLLASASISFSQNVGINEPNPTHTLHIKPLNAGDEPIRIEGIQSAIGGENGMLIHNSADGIVRYINLGQVKDSVDTHVDSLTFDNTTNTLSAWVNGTAYNTVIPAGTGQDGIACWDTNGNGVQDAAEDTNLDGFWDALDCVGADGPAGADGLACWDVNGNGIADPSEDTNLDGIWDASDCGGTGQDGLSCWDINGNGLADPAEDINLDGAWNYLDCIGATGPVGPQGDPGSQGPQGIQGDPGPAGPTWNITSDNFDANGNMVIQTDQPATITSTNAAWLTTGNQGTSATNFLGTIPNQPLIFRTSNVERMRIEGGGNIGIGTNAPLTYLHFVKPTIISNFQTMWDNNLADDAVARFQHTAAANGNRVLFGISNYNANVNASPGVIGIHLNAAGNGGIGVEGFSNSNDGTGILAGFVGGNTVVNGWALLSNGWAGGTTLWQNISDRRIKKDIQNIESPMEKIKQLNGVTYYYDNTTFPELRLDETTLQMGFIAQEIESVFPHLVREANIPGLPEKADNSMSRKQTMYQLKTFSYSNIVPLLLEGIKEQQKEIESLEQRIKALEEKIGK